MKQKYSAAFLLLFLLSGCQSWPNSKEQEYDEGYRETILLKANNYQGLLQLYRDRLKVKEDPKTRLQVASYYYLLNDYEASRHFLAPLLSSNPSQDVFLLEAKNLLDMGERTRALEAVNKVIALNNRNGDAHNIKGIILAESGNFDGAVQSFTVARQELIDDEIVMNNLAMIAILRGNYKQAVDYLMPLYSRGNRSSRLLHNLVFALIKNHDYEAADSILQKENIPTQSREELVSTLDSVQTILKEDNGNMSSLNSDNPQKMLGGFNTESSGASEPMISSDIKPVVETVSELETVDDTANVTDSGDKTSPLVSNAKTETETEIAMVSALEEMRKTSNVTLGEALATAKVAANDSAESIAAAADSVLPLLGANAEAENTATGSNPLLTSAISGPVVTEVRAANHKDSTRLVIESNKFIKFHIIDSNSAKQLIVELDDVELNNVLKNTRYYLKPSNKAIERMTFNTLSDGKLQIIFHFKHNVRANIFNLAPEDTYSHRIVFDLYKSNVK